MEEFVGVTAKLYNELVHKHQHILIAGMTGSGKSVMMNGMINSLLYEDAAYHQLVLIDLKRVEFSRYKDTMHCACFAKTLSEVEFALENVREIIDRRFDEMEQRGLIEWDSTTIHVFVDEMAELMLNSKRAADLLQSICQLGRAAGVQVICATQCPLASVIPTRIKVNFGIVVGLHTQTAQHSRNILEEKGCEMLPKNGEALIKYPSIGIRRTRIPMIDEEWLNKIVAEDKRCYS